MKVKYLWFPKLQLLLQCTMSMAFSADSARYEFSLSIQVVWSIQIHNNIPSHLIL